MVLQLASFGENHREASVFTPDKGLVKAAVFGGAKSRMRAAVNPFHAVSLEPVSRFVLLDKSFEVGKELSLKQELKRFEIEKLYKKEIQEIFES